MKFLSYSPSVEAYVKVGQSGEACDLSKDIVQCSVSRIVDGSSEFSITLANENWKYNGLFSAFDPIVIYCTKTDRHKLFTGYVTQFDAFQLHQGDFKIKGYCTIYRLQQLYWDPYLIESQKLMWANAYNNNQFDNGYANVAKRLLMNVAGWSEAGISIQETIPQEAFDFATEMYVQGQQSSDEMKSMVNEFYQVLQTHGAAMTGGSSGSGGGLADAVDVDLNSADIASIEQLPARIREEVFACSEARQKTVARAIAELGKPYIWSGEGPTGYDCSGLVGYCISGKHKRGHFHVGEIDKWPAVSGNPKPADVWVYYIPDPSAEHGHRGHVQLHIGGGTVIHASRRGKGGVQFGKPDKGLHCVRYFND